MRSAEKMDVVVNETVVELFAPQPKRSSSQVALHLLLFVVTVVIVVVGLRTHVATGITAVNAVAFGQALVWALL
jgi:predicted branched-subunit amino acid permease